jgi:hypothetical protein
MFKTFRGSTLKRASLEREYTKKRFAPEEVLQRKTLPQR